MRPLFLSVLMAASLPAAAASTAPFPFTHNDWTLSCDNTRTCRAAGYQSDEADGPAVSVLLTRAAGPGQRVQGQLMLGQYDEDAPKLAAQATAHLQINGTDLGRLALQDGTGALTAAQTDALLAALTRTSRIEVVAGGGRQRWTLSDSGASAVLLKMDEFQGRLGTPGALVRKGTGSEDKVLPALPAPVVTPAKLPATRAADTALAQTQAAALRTALRAVTPADDCSAISPEGDPMIDGPEELTITRLSSDKVLVSTLCWRAAYNEGYGFWVANDKAPFKPVLVTTSGSDNDGAVINAAHKGRGLGDCWHTSDWTWDGKRFVKTGEATSGLCRLVAAGGAWEMPTVVSKVQP
ncbi:DUF1176 domain-containing protein [Stenotrophomonas sp. ESTM1D_MKCIP4_1]|uniref:DUF1176 domain-containing protein n=1 Tax=Stenotrophomonas sp. ESTM1D_MKCIP4_1 TaxID=2072414 RepID=UPI000D540EFD|nr:DUF1176 domain-containing protein [Stenotrophomonas sp. ESTM1D_MKCIP4_1]AWH53352.1 DUF1176 domain-containing protein [Stenotrophomonas sp. ESTM1D_MKCIP4_1]